MFKMDHGGHGVLYEKKNLHLSLNISEEKMDFVKFRRSCILSGCDYSKGLDGIGLIKANKFFNKTSQEDLYKVGLLLILIRKNFLGNLKGKNLGFTKNFHIFTNVKYFRRQKFHRQICRSGKYFFVPNYF